jgi:hypothetical protein
VPPLELFVVSTILTSIWIVLALAALLVTKFLGVADKARLFTVWFFNVDEHPLRAIGIVAGGIIFVISLLSTLLKGL